MYHIYVFNRKETSTECEDNRELSSTESQTTVDAHHMQSIRNANRPCSESEDTNTIYSEIYYDTKLAMVKKSQDHQLKRSVATDELYEAINGLMKVLEDLRDKDGGNLESMEERIADEKQLHIYTSLVESLLEKGEYSTLAGTRKGGELPRL